MKVSKKREILINWYSFKSWISKLKYSDIFSNKTGFSPINISRTGNTIPIPIKSINIAIKSNTDKNTSFLISILVKDIRDFAKSLWVY